MPDYVQEYIHSKRSSGFSPKTILSYINEYRRFFEWLIDSGVSSATTVGEIPLECLENLSKKDIEAFFNYLQTRPFLTPGKVNKSNIGLSESTISRTRGALSSLYKYLTEESEVDGNEPYFYRNVMKKIKRKAQKETLASRSSRMQSKILIDGKSQELLDYIDNEHGGKISPRAYTSFEKDKERDLALIALFLASGIRVNEASNLDMNSLDIRNMTVDVIRKGNKRDTVNIGLSAKPYLERYLDVRRARYNVDDKVDKALFISNQSGTVKRLGIGAMENIVSKYTESCFGMRLTPHKLRHTLATNLYAATDSPLMVAQQLGHSDLNTVSIYAHITNASQKAALDKL